MAMTTLVYNKIKKKRIPMETSNIEFLFECGDKQFWKTFCMPVDIVENIVIENYQINVKVELI